MGGPRAAGDFGWNRVCDRHDVSDLVDAARSAGALAAKICGAGGGGCVLFYCAADREGPVRRALEDLGGRILDFTFDFSGLQVWAMES